MKNNNSIIIGIISCLLLISFYSCDKDNEGPIYTPEASEASFNFATATLEIEDINEPIAVEITRGGSDAGALTVPVVITDESGFFSVSDAVFADGEKRAKVYIKGNADVQVGPKYTVKIGIAEGYKSAGSVNAMTLTITRAYTWESIGECQFKDSEFFESSWKAEILKADGFERYRIVNAYLKADPTISFETGYNVEFSISESGAVTSFATQNIGWEYSASYGYVHVQLLKGQKTGKEIVLTVKYTLPKAGLSFEGEYKETIVLP